jgi:hypothetical protein
LEKEATRRRGGLGLTPSNLRTQGPQCVTAYVEVRSKQQL